MAHTPATTSMVEAQSGFACAIPDAFDGIGTIAGQPHFQPVTRRDLMAAVNTAGQTLGLRPASVVVLDALLSCLPCNDARTGTDAPITPLMLLTVFASNDTLCFRAKGITDRQLRRHLDRLEHLGLVRRRNSANGKRFPVTRGGRIIGAFGIDLSPLLAQSAAILATARTLRDQTSELRGLRGIIQALRQTCLGLNLPDDAILFIKSTHAMLRRSSLTIAHAHAIIGKLQSFRDTDHKREATAPDSALAAGNDATSDVCTAAPTVVETTEMSASDGQDVRHKETENSETKKPKLLAISDMWKVLTTISAFYPDPPRTQHGLLQRLYEFGKMLRIREPVLAKAVSCLGVFETLRLADQMAESPDRVTSPDSYLSKVIAAHSKGRVGHGQPAFAV